MHSEALSIEIPFALELSHSTRSLSTSLLISKNLNTNLQSPSPMNPFSSPSHPHHDPPTNVLKARTTLQKPSRTINNKSENTFLTASSVKGRWDLVNAVTGRGSVPLLVSTTDIPSWCRHSGTGPGGADWLLGAEAGTMAEGVYGDGDIDCILQIVFLGVVGRRWCLMVWDDTGHFDDLSEWWYYEIVLPMCLSIVFLCLVK